MNLTIAGYALKALAILPDLIKGATTVADAFTTAKAFHDDVHAKLTKMQAEGRDPSEAEWAELNAVAERLHQSIQSA